MGTDYFFYFKIWRKFKKNFEIFQVTLTNEISKEYEWFEVVYDVCKCEPLLTISLSTVVRKSVTYEIDFYNPLDIPVSLESAVELPGLNVEVPSIVDSKQHVSTCI